MIWMRANNILPNNHRMTILSIIAWVSYLHLETWVQNLSFFNKSDFFINSVAKIIWSLGKYDYNLLLSLLASRRDTEIQPFDSFFSFFQGVNFNDGLDISTLLHVRAVSNALSDQDNIVNIICIINAYICIYAFIIHMMFTIYMYLCVFIIFI